MIARIGGPVPADPREKLRHAAKELEAVFMTQLLKAMRETVPDQGIVPRSEGEQMFTGMLDDEIARAAAGKSTHGVGEALFKQLSRFLPAEGPSK